MGIDDEEYTRDFKLRSLISMNIERWFLSTNAKDIGTLYLIFSIFSGLLGTAFSVLIRLELSGPGVQFISNNQLYNSVVTAHAILMSTPLCLDVWLILKGFTNESSCVKKLSGWWSQPPRGNSNS